MVLRPCSHLDFRHGKQWNVDSTTTLLSGELNKWPTFSSSGKTKDYHCSDYLNLLA